MATRITVKHDLCRIYVYGMEMVCPMCKATVRSGETHECGNLTKPKPQQKRSKKRG